METLKTWLDHERGRGSALAQHLHVAPPSVAAWVAGRRPVPVAHALAIEQFTAGQVRRQDLLPYCWQRIWPELATQDTTPDTSASTHQLQPEAATATS